MTVESIINLRGEFHLESIDRDIELEFVREFATGGLHLGPTVSSHDRRERIRVAIFAQKLQRAAFRDSGITYAEAYRKCYGQSIELRSVPRAQSPMEEPSDDLDVDDEDWT